MQETCLSGSMRGVWKRATAEPLRHRQTKGAANGHAQPKATAPHSYFLWGLSESRGHGEAIRADPARGSDHNQAASFRHETSVARAWSTRAGHRLDFYPVRHPGHRRRRNPNPVCCGYCPSRDGTLLYKRRFQPSRSSVTHPPGVPGDREPLGNSKRSPRPFRSRWRRAEPCPSLHSAIARSAAYGRAPPP